MAPLERGDQPDGRTDALQAARGDDRRVQATAHLHVPRDERHDALGPPAHACGGPTPDATVRDRGGTERGGLPQARRAEVGPRVPQAAGDARPPPHPSHADGNPTHPRAGLEPRLGGRIRGTRPRRAADVHRVQRVQLRRREPPAASSTAWPAAVSHSMVRPSRG